MLKENLKTLRKQKGMSQEVLARIADLFDTSVSELLGNQIEQKENVSEIAVQLALLNEQLAQKARIRKRILAVMTIIVFAGAFAAIYPLWNEVWHDFGRNLYHLFNA